MGVHEDIMGTIYAEIGQEYSMRVGRTVPTDATITRSESVLLEAVYLYADLADSSTLAQRVDYVDAARVIRAYINVAVRCIRHKDGHIRSFDGDRVMGIFIGDDKEKRAARAALAINGYVTDDLKFWVYEDLESIKNTGWKLKHGIGVDTGYAYMVRAGIRAFADVVSIGAAPNVAAKLSDVRDSHSIHITDEVWDAMDWEHCYSGSVEDSENAKSMWPGLEYVTIGGIRRTVRSSNWQWKFG